MSGLMTAMFLFLIASGLSLVFGVMRVLNFANGSFYMLGGYLAWQAMQWLHPIGEAFWAAAMFAALGIAVLGGIVERLLRHLYGRDELYQLLLTYALVLIFGDVAKYICRALAGSDDAGAALAEADRGKAVAAAMGAEDHFVAVFDKGAGFARSQCRRPRAVGAQFNQAAIALAGRAGDRVCAEQIAGAEIAAAAGMVRHQLRQGPIEIGRVAPRHTLRRQPFRAQPFGQQKRFEHDIEGARTLVAVVPQMRQRPRVALGPRRLGDAKRRQGLGGDDPRRHGRAEILAEERPQRLRFPLLHISRRPVVDEAEAEDVVAGPGDRNRFALGVAGADPDREFELVIELLRWAVAGCGLARRLARAVRAPDRHARRAH